MRTNFSEVRVDSADASVTMLRGIGYETGAHKAWSKSSKKPGWLVESVSKMA